MRVLYGLENLPAFKNPVVTSGSFDGVHEGHRTLLQKVNSLSRENRGEGVVLTFDPHPRSVLGHRMEVSLLNTLQEKIELMEQLGVENLIVIPFNKEFSRLTSTEFIGSLLVERIGVSTLVIGHDHRFGNDLQAKQGIHELGIQFGFRTLELPCKTINGECINSSRIRELIKSARLADASQLLGYNYFAHLSYDGSLYHTQNALKLLPPRGKYTASVHSAENPDSVFRSQIEIVSAGSIRIADMTESTIAVVFDRYQT